MKAYPAQDISRPIRCEIYGIENPHYTGDVHVQPRQVCLYYIILQKPIKITLDSHNLKLIHNATNTALN
jgi:hypothetical protein